MDAWMSSTSMIRGVRARPSLRRAVLTHPPWPPTDDVTAVLPLTAAVSNWEHQRVRNHPVHPKTLALGS